MKNFIWIVMVLFTTKLSAQSSYVFRDADIISSSPLPNNIEQGTLDVIADDSTVFRIGFSKAQKLVVTSYELSTLVLTNRQELSLEYGGKALAFEKATILGNSLVVFLSFYNINDQTKYLFSWAIDKKTLQFAPAIKKVAEATHINSAAESLWSNFNFQFDEGSNNVAIVAETYRQRKDFETFSISVIDSACNSIWSKNIELPYEESMFSIESYCVNSQGDVFIIGYLFHEKPHAKVKGKPNYSYKILRYNADGSQHTHDVRLADKFVHSLQAQIDNDNTLIYAGFYNNKNKNNIGGTFYASFDLQTNQPIQESYREFDSNLLAPSMSDKELARYKKRETKGKNTELPHYKFRGLVKRSDGGAVLVGESMLTERTHVRNAQGYIIGRREIYNHDNIFVANVSPEGNIDWVNIIPKQQRFAHSYAFSSFVFATHKDEIYFIFNDNAQNIPYDKNQKIKPFKPSIKHGIVSITSINSQGIQKRFELTRSIDTRSVIQISASSQISSDDVILLTSPINDKNGGFIQRLTFK